MGGRFFGPGRRSTTLGNLASTIKRIRPANKPSETKARERIARLTMPPGALGRILELAVRLAGISRSLNPPTTRKVIVTMAGDHGVVAEGVSAFPQEVTAQMVHNFVACGAAINVLARLVGAEVVVVDMGVAADLSALADSGRILSKKIAPGTQNMAVGPAMTRDQAVASVEAGIEVVEGLCGKGLDVLGAGDMGIGNTTPSAAIAAVLTGRSVREVTGRGTGVDDKCLDRKVAAIEKAVAVNRPDPSDPMDVLSKVGGFEIGGLAGCVLAAAAHRKPVLIDGLISTAGALIAARLCPAAKDYIIASHRSVETGHRAMLEAIGVEPFLDLGMRLGEGTGAALAMNLVEAAKRILTEMATFDAARVSTKLSD
ncbi:MAG: nicotinate-nucleotide--dimethylbenzimidazole phosphoribosyltransferase [Planctomycetota bacterium]